MEIFVSKKFEITFRRVLCNRSIDKKIILSEEDVDELIEKLKIEKQERIIA
jgi:hypothetical protein